MNDNIKQYELLEQDHKTVLHQIFSNIREQHYFRNTNISSTDAIDLSLYGNRSRIKRLVKFVTDVIIQDTSVLNNIYFKCIVYSANTSRFWELVLRKRRSNLYDATFL